MDPQYLTFYRTKINKATQSNCPFAEIIQGSLDCRDLRQEKLWNTRLQYD